MNERPKSREETPKEGSGMALESHAALQQYVIAPHKKQGSNDVLAAFSEHWCITVTKVQRVFPFGLQICAFRPLKP